MNDRKYTLNAYMEKDNSKLLERLFSIEKGFKEKEVLNHIEELYINLEDIEERRTGTQEDKNSIIMEIKGQTEYLVENTEDLDRVVSILDPYRRYIEHTEHPSHMDSYEINDSEDPRDKRYDLYTPDKSLEATLTVERENNIIDLEMSLSEPVFEEESLEIYREILQNRGYNIR